MNTPAPHARIRKGVLSANQQTLSLAQRTRFNQLVQQGIDPKVARQLALALEKSASRGERLAEAALAKAGYARSFVDGAKDALPKTYFDQLHTQARARAGGKASGMARRAMSDASKAQLLSQRDALREQLKGIEAELAKSAPLEQEVSVDAPIALTPGAKKKRDKLAARIAAQAMQAVKSAPPKGKERVDFALPAKIVKTAAAPHKRIVHSVVYAPGDVDAHGDYMDADTIEKMAHDAMRTGLYVNHEHQADAIEADIVESYVAPQDFNLTLDDGQPYHIPKGSHVMAMHVWGDEPWQKILAGEYVGYSLEGTALRDVS